MATATTDECWSMFAPAARLNSGVGVAAIAGLAFAASVNLAHAAVERERLLTDPRAWVDIARREPDLHEQIGGVLQVIQTASIMRARGARIAGLDKFRVLLRGATHKRDQGQFDQALEGISDVLESEPPAAGTDAPAHAATAGTVSSANTIERTLGGDWRAGCFVVERRRDPNARHGREQVAALGGGFK